MNTESLTIPDVLEIFADYLNRNDNVEIIETLKMGYLLLFDGSRMSNRSMIDAMEIPDSETLARQLLDLEVSDIYYASKHRNEEPCDCEESFFNEVCFILAPRLKQLPIEWRDEVVRFFFSPDEDWE